MQAKRPVRARDRRRGSIRWYTRAMDYAHARHAGNVGDVFKHVALVAVLEELLKDPLPLRYVESHAGDGMFPLGSNGEWSAGIQLLWELKGADAAGRFVELVRGFSGPAATRPGKYPGSPVIAQKLLRAQDSLLLHELEPQAAGVLLRTLGTDARAEVRETDGLAALPGALAPRAQAGEVEGRVFALIDPPYTQKGEWADTAAAVIAARKTGAAVAVWYPIKALTRPRALLAALVEGGLHGTLVELISTPLRLKREKLNGSGIVLLGVPDAAVSGLCAVLPRLGPLLATHGEWSATQIGF